MARTLVNAAARSAIFAQSSGMVLPILLTVSGPPVGVINICNNNVALTYGGVPYQPYAFRFDPPDMTRDDLANARITIDATDQTLINILRQVTTAPIVTARAMYYNDSTGATVFEEIVPWRFTMRNVSYDASVITADLIYEDLLENQMGPVEFSSRSFPGVH